MELRQLKYFCKTAELLSFSEAAKALYITQSTLSQQIKQLEGELGVQLFQRNSHGVTLTEMGIELLPYAKTTMSNAESCIEHIRDVQNLMTGTLNIGVTYTFSPTLNETLLTFMKLHRNVKLNIYNKTMEELMTMLEKRDVDIVLSFKPTHTYDHIESHILFDNYLSVVVNSEHELAKHRSIDLRTLQQYKMALPGKGLQARNQFDMIVANGGYKFDCPIELNEVNILLKMVLHSNLVTILSEATIYGEEGLVAVPIDAPGTQMEGCVHVLRDSYRKCSAIEFVKLLCESETIRKKVFKWLDS